MNLQPTLESELLFIRPLQSTDFTELYTAAADSLIWEQHPQPDRYKPDIFKKFFDEALQSKGAVVIIDRKNNKMIGSSRFYDYSEPDSSVLVGYTFIARPYWGGKYNYDLKKLMVNYCLDYVKTVYFQVGTKNIRSQKALKKIGAINTGVQNVVVSYAPPKPSYIYKMEHKL